MKKNRGLRPLPSLSQYMVGWFCSENTPKPGLPILLDIYSVLVDCRPSKVRANFALVTTLSKQVLMIATFCNCDNKVMLKTMLQDLNALSLVACWDWSSICKYIGFKIFISKQFIHVNINFRIIRDLPVMLN